MVSAVEIVANRQVMKIQLIEVDENQANPSRRPPPGIDFHARGHDRGDAWPTDANRLIDGMREIRELAALLNPQPLNLLSL
ncbi:hypothetical protein WAI453_007381 [Rhynchosporium graminicola]